MSLIPPRRLSCGLVERRGRASLLLAEASTRVDPLGKPATLSVMRKLVATKGPLNDTTPEALAAALAAGSQGFWLDIESPTDDDYVLLEKTFGFHPLTIEDARHQNQRPKLEEYAHYDFIVVFTGGRVDGALEMQEHHIYLAPQYLVSLHIDPSPSLAALRDRIEGAPELLDRGVPFLFYLVVDQLVDSLFPLLDEIDEDSDGLQDKILDNPDTAQLAQIQKMKHSVVELRRVLGAQRDVFLALTTHAIGGHDDLNLYFRDVYDHLVRQYETADAQRDLLSSAMDIYLSTVSNRLNDVMRRLTVIATLFMPLSFITGFFGMNFAWLVARITTLGSFILVLVLMCATVGVQFSYFRRRRWV